MREECVQSVISAARAMGRKLRPEDVQRMNVDGDIRAMRKQLAREDINAYRGMTEQQQIEAALMRVAQAKIAEKILAKQREALTIQKKYALTNEVAAIAQRTGEDQLPTLFRLLFAKQDGRGANFSLETRIRATRLYFHNMLGDLFKMNDRGYLASVFTDPEATGAFIKEMFGEDSGHPQAKAAAEAVNRVLDAQIKEYQGEGGILRKLENWRLPQATSALKALRMGQDAWVQFTKGLIDRTQYVKEDGSQMTDGEITEFLQEAWFSLAHDGAAKAPKKGKAGQEAGAMKPSSALGNQRQAHRQLFFKDAAAWQKYNEALGDQDAYSMILNHIDGLSTDIATMKVLGHNPVALFRTLIEDARIADARKDTGGTKAEGKLQKALAWLFGEKAPTIWDDAAKLEKALEYLIGGGDRPSNTRLARFLRAYRSYRVATLLGSLPGSMLPDQATMKMIGLQNRVATGLIWEAQKAFATSPSFRANLKAMGLAIESVGEELARVGERDGNLSGAGRLATLVHRLSLATAINNGERAAMQVALTATWGRLVKGAATLADLHPQDAAVLLSKGLTDADWAIWRQATLDELDGVEMLTPKSIEMVDDAAVRDAIPDRIEAIEREAAEVVADLEKRNVQENEWLAKRLQKFEDYKAKAADWLDKFRVTREKAQQGLLAQAMGDIADLRSRREGQTAEVAARAEQQVAALKAELDTKAAEFTARTEARAELLQAETARAEVEADIATYLRTAKDIEAQRRLLEQVEEGASAEKAAGRSKRVTEDLVKAQGKTGEALGARRERANAAVRELEAKVKQLEKAHEDRIAAREREYEQRIADLEKKGDKDSAKLEAQYARRLREMERKAEREIAAKEKELNERIYKRMFDLADFMRNMEERVAVRQALAQRWQDSVGTKIEAAVANARAEAVRKLYGALDGEVNTAVLQPGAADNFGLKAMGGALSPNSTMGEVVQTLLQFKAFPWAYFRRHLDRAALNQAAGGSRAGYLLGTMGATTAYAGAGLILLAMARGEDPQDITEKPGEFGLKAFMKGGGLGFYGDILLSQDEFGNKPLDQLWGPAFGDINTAIRVGQTAAKAGMAEDPQKEVDKAARDTVRLFKQNFPFQNLWYTRAMTDRWIFNNAQEWANPGAMERMRNRAQQKGTSYWWQPGEAAPDRLPALGKAVGESATQ